MKEMLKAAIKDSFVFAMMVFVFCTIIFFTRHDGSSYLYVIYTTIFSFVVWIPLYMIKTRIEKEDREDEEDRKSKENEENNNHNK